MLIAFETGDSHNAQNHKQFAGNAVAHTLPWLEGLKAITINPAKIYGMDKSTGTLEAGKDADVVVWSGDLLEVTNFADAVFIRGEAVPMTSRQTDLRDRYHPYIKDPVPKWPPAYSHP